MTTHNTPSKPAVPAPNHEHDHEAIHEELGPDTIGAPPPSLPIAPPHVGPTDRNGARTAKNRRLPEPEFPWEPGREERYDQLLREHVYPLVEAAREAGLHPAPSIDTLLRACSAGKLASIKLAGRRLTSASAIRRWVIAEQETGIDGR